MILHQKLSTVVAQEVFGVTENGRAQRHRLPHHAQGWSQPAGQNCFVADKIQWDQPGEPPYWGELVTAVARLIDDACRVYLNHLWQQRDTLRFVHPWFVAAREELA